MTRYAALAVTLLLLLAVGCAAQTPSVTPAAGPPEPAVELVGEDEADLHLWISNQSFADDPVGITVTVDGVTVVDRDFDVESQHNWQLFPVALDPGRHTLRAESHTGIVFERSFVVPEGSVRYAVLDYWNYEDRAGRHFSWDVRRQPVAFM